MKDRRKVIGLFSAIVIVAFFVMTTERNDNRFNAEKLAEQKLQASVDSMNIAHLDSITTIVNKLSMSVDVLSKTLKKKDSIERTQQHAVQEKLERIEKLERRILNSNQ